MLRPESDSFLWIYYVNAEKENHRERFVYNACAKMYKFAMLVWRP